MKITKILCDRCGATIEDEHTPRIITQVYEKSDKATSPSKYVNAKTIHLCHKCNIDFEDFLESKGE